jgi:hypothetical protein
MQRSFTLSPRRPSVPATPKPEGEDTRAAVGYDAILGERLLEAVRPVPAPTPAERTDPRREAYQLD